VANVDFWVDCESAMNYGREQEPDSTKCVRCEAIIGVNLGKSL
jgi:hypothetical protein